MKGSHSQARKRPGSPLCKHMIIYILKLLAVNTPLFANGCIVFYLFYTVSRF